MYLTQHNRPRNSDFLGATRKKEVDKEVSNELLEE